MKYLVQWKYKSSLGGPWMKGDVVEIDDRLADAVNRDSPGVLKPAAEALSKEDRRDRMMRAEQTYARGAEEPITRGDFKAVKGK
jgi:hypothetical protein